MACTRCVILNGEYRPCAECSESKRESYRWNSMSVAERTDLLRQWAAYDKATLREIERRVGEIEKRGDGYTVSSISASELARTCDELRPATVIRTSEYSRLLRLESEHAECQHSRDAMHEAMMTIIRDLESKLAQAGRIEDAARAFRDQVTFCGGVTLQRLHDELGDALGYRGEGE
jgi:predicted Fe-S protein YdhL (DUF1289 family)